MSDIQEEQKRLYKIAEENDLMQIPNKIIENTILIKQTGDKVINKMKKLQEENKRLKDLCDKYEEEHNNEFQCWKRDRKELLDKRNRINKAIEYTNQFINFKTSRIDEWENVELVLETIVSLLKGDNK